jgi:hypothetical protein
MSRLGWDIESLERGYKDPSLLLGLVGLQSPITSTRDRDGMKLTAQKYMGKQAAQYEPEDPHYVMSTDSRGKKKRMVVSLVGERR